MLLSSLRANLINLSNSFFPGGDFAFSPEDIEGANRDKAEEKQIENLGVI